MQIVLQALKALAESNLARLQSPLAEGLPWPGLPVTFAPATASYWSAHNRAASNSLIGYGRNDELPKTADVVIIGAGISGVSAAHFLINSGNSPDKVVLLEAREVSSGATGRNGGFIKPVPFRTYGDYKALFGKEEALHLIQSEYDTLELTAELVERWEINAGFALRPHREIVLDKATARTDRALLELIREDREAFSLPQIDDVEWYEDSEEARSVTRSRTAVEAYTYKCGSIWPHKLVHALLANILTSSRRLMLFTHTPATSIHRSTGDNGTSVWHVHTPRGTILTPKLIVTTNGHTSTLLPALFMGRIVPKRTQMSALTPPASFGAPLDFTFNIRGEYNSSTWPTAEPGYEWPQGLEEAYGMTTSDGTMVLGGELAQRASDIDGVTWMGSTDDTRVFSRTTEYFRNMPRINFDGWDSEGVGEGLFRTWTGIQGHTIDTLPFVGTVPGKRHEGLYISAGFHGHGMARCLVASRGLVHQLLSSNNEWDPRLPRTFQITKKRLNTTAESMLEELIEGRKRLGLND